MALRDSLAVHNVVSIDTAPLVLAGRSAAVSRLRSDIDAASQASCVLLEAEAGLDVVEIARDVHSRRPAGPFVIIECAAHEPGQAERELFGDVRPAAGADLEAVAAASAVARAHGGTLYLADVAELSAAAQLRIARLVRDGEGLVDGAATRLDVQVIASSVAEASAAPSRMCRELQRHFARMTVAVPPLRRRAEDVPVLVERLVATLYSRREAPQFTHPAMTLLSAMPWTGNIAELRHAIARLANAAVGGVIQLEDVLAHVRFDGSLVPRTPAGTLRDARQQFERDYIALVIQHHRGHVGEAAKALGIQRTNLYRKARQLGIAVSKGVEK
jgi:two-component system, NtrC family, nitrogen regulation response regulator NtrX